MRRYLLLAAVLLLVALQYTLSASSSTSGQTQAKVLLGDDSLGVQHAVLGASRREAFRVRARATGAVGAVHIYIDSASRAGVVVGIYANAGGRPGALLGAGLLSSPKREHWDTIRISRAAVSAGRDYWLAILGRGGVLHYRQSRRGGCRGITSLQNALHTMPRHWAAGQLHLYASCPISAFGVQVSTSTPEESSAQPGSSANPSKGQSAVTPAAAPGNSALPKISGTAVRGQTLTASKGTWSETPTSYSYQWQDCNAKGESCTALAGASASSYTLRAGDVAHTLRVTVTAGNGAGKTSATSAPSGVIAEAVNSPPVSPPCTSSVSSVSTAASQLKSAASGAAICLAAGTYGQLSVSGSHAGNVTIEPVIGASVKLASVSVEEGASNVTVHNFSTDEIDLKPGVSHLTIDHNDISGGGEGVINNSVNCDSPNAPQYAGCTSTTPDSYITISNNKIHGFGEGGGEDAVHLSNWEHITITANDIYNLEEHGNHTDAFQSVFGGSGMTFDHNYEHDNQSQGFFIKDGDASNVTVTDNLFLRNDNLGEGENNIQVFNTTNFVMTDNTVWDGQGDLIRAEGAAEALSAEVNHNVEQTFAVLHAGGPEYQLTEDYDIFSEMPFDLPHIGAHSKVVAKPAFKNTAADDYRLTSNPSEIGVDWAPSEYVYGPTGD